MFHAPNVWRPHGLPLQGMYLLSYCTDQYLSDCCFPPPFCRPPAYPFVPHFLDNNLAISFSRYPSAVCICPADQIPDFCLTDSSATGALPTWATQKNVITAGETDRTQAVRPPSSLSPESLLQLAPALRYRTSHRQFPGTLPRSSTSLALSPLTTIHTHTHTHAHTRTHAHTSTQAHKHTTLTH
jgi:hypothetical protein